MSLFKSLITVGLSLSLLGGVASASPEEATSDAAVATESAAPAPESKGEETKPNEVVVAGEDRVICKYIKTTGSRFGSKQCMTKSQWDLQRKNSQEEAGSMQRTAK